MESPVPAHAPGRLNGIAVAGPKALMKSMDDYRRRRTRALAARQKGR